MKQVIIPADEARMAWVSKARCRAIDIDPDELFVRGAAQKKATAICRRCPVIVECAADALDNQVEWGIWGGMTERQRRALLRRHPEVVSWAEFFAAQRKHPTARLAAIHNGEQTGDAVKREWFEEFLTDAPFEGLGITVKHAQNIVRHDKKVKDALVAALQRPPGNPTGRNQYPPGTFDNAQGSSTAPSGTSESAALRRLRKNHPDLHAQVLADELSVHAAMVQAGFRHHTVTIRTDSPTAIARTLRRNLKPQVLEALATELAKS